MHHASNALFAPSAHTGDRNSSFFLHFTSFNSCVLKNGKRFLSGTVNTVCKMPRLTNIERGRAIGMLQSNLSASAVARRLNCDPSTITRLQERYRATGSTQDRPRSGQPRVTTRRQDVYIRTAHLRDRFRTATSTSRQLVGRRGQVSADTVRRRLRSGGLQARRPYVGPRLSRVHRQRRLNWARIHQRLTRRQWGNVVFSDESRFTLSRADGRSRVWRRPGERYADACVLEADRWGGGSVMVWGAFSNDYRTPLHFFNGHVNAGTYQQVLQTHIVPLFRRHQHLQAFQQDNARPHTARATTVFLQVSTR